VDTVYPGRIDSTVLASEVSGLLGAR
jgi:hypothetical protein